MFCLKALNLSYSYNETIPVLSGVNFTLSEGESLFIEGPNGSGKSTLLSLIAGIRSLQMGQLICSYKKKIFTEGLTNFIYLGAERSGLDLTLSAEENLVFFLKLRDKSISASELNYLLDKWGFSSNFIKRFLPVGCFSTGMKRRLALARVESLNCQLWLLDEPALGLDQKALKILIEAIDEHKRKKGALIFTSHDFSFSKEVKTQMISLS